MSLEEKLAAIREGSAKRNPPERLATMKKATEDLRASGILDGVAKPGDTLPEFSLQNAYGVEVHSADLFSQGPVVITAFRGVW
jgi:hypothetical protein